MIHRQKGAAIIMVLLIVAMATSLATYMAMQQNLWNRQVENQYDRTQALQISSAGIEWAKAVLAEDSRINNSDNDKEIWTLHLPAVPVEGGEVMGAIEDRQGIFNLNNASYNIDQFQRLLEILGLPADLAPALADWIDTDTETRSGGGEDGYYLALAEPYRTPNRPLIELGELMKVKGFDSHAIETLRAFVCVLPATRTPININFAPAEVMAAVIDGLSLSDARLMVQQRQFQPYKDNADFKQRLPHRGIRVTDSDISVKSEYFWVTGRASFGHSQVVTHALLQRANNWPTVIWKSIQ